MLIFSKTNRLSYSYYYTWSTDTWHHSEFGTTSTGIQGLADARKRAHRSGLVQFFAVYQFDRGGILQMCHTVGELCNHAVRGSVVWRVIPDTICEFTVNSVF